MANGRHFENVKRDISATVWLILMKFGTVMHIGLSNQTKILITIHRTRLWAKYQVITSDLISETMRNRKIIMTVARWLNNSIFR